MIPHQYQHDMAAECIPILNKYGIVYIAAEERTGKTLVSLLTANAVKTATVLIVCKKINLDNWVAVVNDQQFDCAVINYEMLHKINRKYNLVILDECHSFIACYPKPNKTVRTLKNIVSDKVIYMSATSNAQGYQQLYHQLYVSPHSPFKRHINFYSWFKEYYLPGPDGKMPVTYITNQITAYDYKKIHPKAFEAIRHLFVFKTREELGFAKEPEDKLHYVQLGQTIKTAYNTLLTKSVLKFTAQGKLWSFDGTGGKKTFALHMMEGGVIKIDNEYVQLGNCEKVNYIKSIWGDSSDTMIMYNYVAEGTKLKEHFKNAHILQATTYAEGVDLSHIKHMVVYSQNYSTAKYIQRRCRQANMAREDDIIVHYILVKRAVSEKLYKTVAINRKNFTEKLFKGETL